ncbi:hypothetical protein D3C81_1135180 [compost metagenome]
MGDGGWIRAYNGKGIWTASTLQADGSVNSGYISSWGRVRAGEYMQIDGMANENWGCGPNGLVGRDGPGALLSCQNGLWKKLGGSDPPAGSLCGVQWNTGAPTVSCMGIGWGGGPMACPGGWGRTEVLVEGGNRMYMCVKY